MWSSSQFFKLKKMLQDVLHIVNIGENKKDFRVDDLSFLSACESLNNHVTHVLIYISTSVNLISFFFFRNF